MKEDLETLRKKWEAEMAGWEHAAEMSKADEGVYSRCMVRVWTLKGCLDDFKNYIKLS